jgi:hypothetical protein
MYGPIFPVNGRKLSVKIPTSRRGGAIPGGIYLPDISNKELEKTFCINFSPDCINFQSDFIFILANRAIFPN